MAWQLSVFGSRAFSKNGRLYRKCYSSLSCSLLANRNVTATACSERSSLRWCSRICRRTPSVLRRSRTSRPCTDPSKRSRFGLRSIVLEKMPRPCGSACSCLQTKTGRSFSDVCVRTADGCTLHPLAYAFEDEDPVSWRRKMSNPHRFDDDSPNLGALGPISASLSKPGV